MVDIQTDILDEGFSLVVKNPGIPIAIQLFKKQYRKEFLFGPKSSLLIRISEAPIIAITGSNGKTTTTTLLYHILNIGGKSH